MADVKTINAHCSVCGRAGLVAAVGDGAICRECCAEAVDEIEWTRGGRSERSAVEFVRGMTAENDEKIANCIKDGVAARGRRGGK